MLERGQRAADRARDLAPVGLPAAARSPRATRAEPPILEPRDYGSPDPFERRPRGDHPAGGLVRALRARRSCAASSPASCRRRRFTTSPGCGSTEVGEGRRRLRAARDRWLASPARRLQGGVIAMQADFAMLAAVETMAGRASAIAGLDLKANFLRPVPPDGTDLDGARRGGPQRPDDRDHPRRGHERRRKAGRCWPPARPCTCPAAQPTWARSSSARGPRTELSTEPTRGRGREEAPSPRRAPAARLAGAPRSPRACACRPPPRASSRPAPGPCGA